MSELIVRARAPSNIALIKYMGKKDALLNIPENPSISLTLNSLCSLAEVEISKSDRDSVSWIPERPRFRPENLASNLEPLVPQLSDRGIGRAIQHFERVKEKSPEIFYRFGLELSSDLSKGRNYVLRTANTFPASSGIASSASSFAAITLAAAASVVKDAAKFQKAWEREPSLRRAFARISRQGSGSSCRSFEGPWVLWEREDAAAMNTEAMPKVAHFVILIRTEPKRVSSSSAHSLIRTSPLWDARVERVESRTSLMMAALGSVNFTELARIAWAEAWEMHSLFHTCAEPFSYWEPGTLEGLQWFAPMMSEPSPPIVTLDAGPNIHVIVDYSLREKWRNRLKEHFVDSLILEDEQGHGANLEGVL